MANRTSRRASRSDASFDLLIRLLANCRSCLFFCSYYVVRIILNQITSLYSLVRFLEFIINIFYCVGPTLSILSFPTSILRALVGAIYDGLRSPLGTCKLIITVIALTIE